MNALLAEIAYWVGMVGGTLVGLIAGLILLFLIALIAGVFRSKDGQR